MIRIPFGSSRVLWIAFRSAMLSMRFPVGCLGNFGTSFLDAKERSEQRPSLVKVSLSCWTEAGIVSGSRPGVTRPENWWRPQSAGLGPWRGSPSSLR